MTDKRVQKATSAVLTEAAQEAHVWIWLPGHTAPVVAGRLARRADLLVFNYGRSYLERDDAIAIYAPELPLTRSVLPLLPGMTMPSCIRDASPDAWGEARPSQQEAG